MTSYQELDMRVAGLSTIKRSQNMFGFGKKRTSKKRDNVIGFIANVIDHILPEKGYEKFSSGYIHISDEFGGAGWSSGSGPQLAIFAFKVSDIELHEILMDEIYGTQTDMHKTMTVDMYCSKVHQYLKENFKEYRDLDFLDKRLS